jgi:L-ribulokinase
LVPDRYGVSLEEKFIEMERRLSVLAPGQTGLLALDWNNGNRTILVDVRLTGLLLGQTLHTQAHEIYRALIEATAFGARTIIERVEEYGVPIDTVVNIGGLGKRLKVAASDQTCALGAAIFGAVSSGKISIEAAQAKLCAYRERVYDPIPENQLVYNELYDLYKTLHDAFGSIGWQGSLGHVMKRLLEIRARAAGPGLG